MRRKFHIATIFCLLTVTLSAQNQEPQSQFAKDFLHVWGVSVKNTVDVAEAMPEELYSFQPNDSSKTFGDQLGHIAFTVKFLTDGFVNGIWTEFKDPDTSEMSKEEVIDLLKTNLAVATANIASMSEEEANETIQAFAGRMLKRYVTILFVQDHMTNHRAKANLYIRMNSIVPPDYAFFN